MKMNRGGGRRATVHYDASGKIAAIVVEPAATGAPAGGIMNLPGCKRAEMEIPRELVGANLLEIHLNYQVSVKGREAWLVRKEPEHHDRDSDGRKQQSRSTKKKQVN